MGAIPQKVYKKVQDLQKEGSEFQVLLHAGKDGKITRATVTQEIDLSDNEQTDN